MLIDDKKMPIIELLRFSVLYGLDGVMKDILLGRYGDHDGDLTVNSLVPLDDMPLMHPDEEVKYNWKARRCPRSRLYWPLYALGALVGHKNIVTVALKEFGGKYDVSCGEEFALRLEEGVEIVDDHTLPSEMFHWIFQKNILDMIECGFQFRWIDHKKIFFEDYIRYNF